MRVAELFEQLKARRVIRAAVIYAAFVWAVLQAADLFAGENIIPEQWVRWLIVLAAIGFPLVIISSWFLEGPWKERGRAATAGDLFVIVAITAGAGMFAWQQWFSTTVQMTIAIGEIEATDMQTGTPFLADHLEPELLAVYIEENADNGLLFLQQSLGWFAASQTAPPPRRLARTNNNRAHHI